MADQIRQEQSLLLVLCLRLSKKLYIRPASFFIITRATLLHLQRSQGTIVFYGSHNCRVTQSLMFLP